MEESLKESGKNRPELEKVLAHYANDSLKLQAAYFLISNMPGHHSWDSPQLSAYRNKMDSIYPEASSVTKRVVYSIPWHNDFSMEARQRVEDIQVIKGDFLIKHIDNAIAMWKTCPWLKELPFEDFCEYLLPYRVGDEPLTSMDETHFWWKVVQQSMMDYQFTPRLDDIKSFQNMYIINNDAPYYLTMPWKGKDTYTMDCLDMCYYDILGFRQTGIPSTIDLIPNWATRNGRHYWCAIIDQACMNDNFSDTYNPVTGKVYRMTYSHNPIPIPNRKDSIPEFFQNPFLKDVTEKYIKITSVEVSLSNHIKGHSPHYLYLAVFNDMEWKPVAWSSIKRDKARFDKMGLNIVYLPIYYQGKQQYCADYPFHIDKMGRIKKLCADKKSLITLELTRKYPMTYLKVQWGKSIEGSIVEAANDIDFAHADTLATITSMGNALNWTSVPIHANKSYRYWRVSKLRHPITLAGLKFILQNGQKTIGEPLLSKRGDSNLNAFDNNPLTSGNYMDWVGCDLKEAQNLSEIRLLPRTDDNGISIGHQYRLFYFGKDGWVKVGEQRATQQKLIFNNVPSGALYWLQDITEGHEERIFTYEDGKAVFH